MAEENHLPRKCLHKLPRTHSYMRSHSASYLQTSQVMCILILLAVTIINKGTTYFFCLFSVTITIYVSMGGFDLFLCLCFNYVGSVWQQAHIFSWFRIVSCALLRQINANSHNAIRNIRLPVPRIVKGAGTRWKLWRLCIWCHPDRPLWWTTSVGGPQPVPGHVQGHCWRRVPAIQPPAVTNPAHMQHVRYWANQQADHH